MITSAKNYTKKKPPNQKTLSQNPRTNGKSKAIQTKSHKEGFPGGAVVKNPPANAGDTGSSPGLGRFHMPRSN